MIYVKNQSLSIHNRFHDFKITIIGLGGTGSLLAEQIAKLNYAMLNSNHCGIRLTLIDFDVVEQKNIGRQNFFPNEIGLYKVEALTKRLSRNYLMRTIDFNVIRFEDLLIPTYSNEDLIISCVDNFETRNEIFENVKYPYLLDIGNEKDFGQIILSKRNELKHTFNIFGKSESRKQNNESDYSCGNYADQFEKQGLYINSIMATYAAELIRDFITNDTIDYNCIFVNLKEKTTKKALKIWQ